MANIRPSNLERRKLRDECRELLSKHIENKIGIKVAPSQVRLKPKVSDLYRWKFIPCDSKRSNGESCFLLVPGEVDRLVATTGTVEDKVRSRLTELFSKNISDHSAGAYRELCEGVGKTFEAVPSTLTLADASDSIVSLQCPEISFSAKIEQLENDNARLFHELCQWKDKATAESKHRQLAEEEAGRQYDFIQQLQNKIREYSDTANRLTGCVMSCFQGLDKVLPALEELKSELTVEIAVAR